METKKKNGVNDVQQSSNYDELFMHRTMLFAHSLKDLRNIKDQLYSAAEYFEDSYHKSDHDELLLESLKDYVSKALINTIDHLGSVTHKVNNILDEHVHEVSETRLRVLCIEQRLRSCQTYSDHGGLSQQSLVIQTPKYHKQYLLSDGLFSGAVQAEIGKAHSSGSRKMHSGQASTNLTSDLVAFSFTKAASNKRLEKRSRSVSPLRFSLKRAGSATNRSTTPSFPVRPSGSVVHGSTGPYSSTSRQRHPSEAWRSRSSYPEREITKDIEVYSKKTRNLFKALLSIHKAKNDSGLYR